MMNVIYGTEIYFALAGLEYYYTLFFAGLYPAFTYFALSALSFLTIRKSIIGVMKCFHTNNNRTKISKEVLF